MVHKHFELLAWATLVLVAWPLNSAQSQPPAAIGLAPSPAERVHSNATPSGPCVLLRNDNVLFGRARQVGEYVVVRTGEGGEVQLPRQQVACWADSTRDLYQFRVDHRQKGDLAARLRDARWCLRYDLYELAAQEIRAVRTYDPANIEAKRIEGELKRLTSPRAPAHPNLIGQPSSVRPADYETSAPNLGGVDLATLRGFASHVQPMLLNRCSRCHSHESTPVSGWSLVAPSAGARASSRMTQANLAASLQYINPAVPEESELLIKATAPHGGSDAPLDQRNAKAIESLKSWVAMASRAAGTPSPVEHSGTRQDVATPPQIETTIVAERPVVTDAKPPGTAPSHSPARLPRVTNPFDPELFNRRFHSQ